MRKSRFTEEQIVAILKESEAGASTQELCRRHGISTNTFYNWRKKYGGLDVSEAKRLKQLEDENNKLKRIVADQQLDIVALKDVLGKSGEPREPEVSRQPPPRSPQTERAPRLPPRRAFQVGGSPPTDSDRSRWSTR